MTIEWQESLATGNIEIDTQHKELFDRLNELITAGKTGKADAEVGNLLLFLKKYVLAHFSTEEQLQLNYGYPHYSEHKEEHDTFIKGLHNIEEQFARQGASPAMVKKISKMAFEWLVNHILEQDKKMAGFITSHDKRFNGKNVRCANNDGDPMKVKQDKKHTILIVDDAPENVSVLQKILSAEYAIKTATNGIDALEIAQATPIDLILLDINMPDMNGYDVCKLLKADSVTKKIPVIFVTSLHEHGEETRGFEVGGVDYITKPVFVPVLCARVKTHLALKDAQDALEGWNANLKKRLLQSVSTIREKSQVLISHEEKAPGLRGHILAMELLSGVFEMLEVRHGSHARAVCELAGDAARKMNLGAEEVTKIRLAGLLHDVGRIGSLKIISEYASDMTANELFEYHKHPLRSQDVCKSLEEFHDIGLMIRGHHEDYNGSGFPDGLKGDDIPLGARLLAIADLIDLMATSVKGERAEYALMHIRRHAGTRLDPRLISYFTGITRILYFEGKKPFTTGEVEVPPHLLVSGLQLSRDLISETGVLLLQKGDKLDYVGIGLIRNNSRMNLTSKGGVWVYVNNPE